MWEVVGITLFGFVIIGLSYRQHLRRSNFRTYSGTVYDQMRQWSGESEVYALGMMNQGDMTTNYSHTIGKTGDDYILDTVLQSFEDDDPRDLQEMAEDFEDVLK